MSRAQRISVPRSDRRAGLFALLALFVLGQVHSAAHHALVRHEACALHGELAHGAGDHHHPSRKARHHAAVEVARGGSGAALTGPLLSRVEHRGEDGHGEHCRVLTQRELGRTGPSAATPRVQPPAAAVGALAWRSQRQESCIPIVLFAPKQSPPAAA